MEYDYYRLLQRKELDELRSLFGKRLLVMADDERLSSFFCDQAALPLSLLPSLLRNYASLAYPLEASGTQKRSTETKGRTLESPTNPVGEQPPSVFPFSKCCVDEVLSMCAAVPTVLRLDVFEDYWDSFLCGYSPKQRLYRLLGDGGVVTYIHLKRLVCDYLLMHPKTVQVIHEMNPHGNACALDPSGFDNITHPTSFCRFCSVYVITVAAAILFDLTGCISSVVYPRQLNESRLVGVYSSFHLVVHSSPVGSEACFARFPLRAHLFTRFESMGLVSGDCPHSLCVSIQQLMVSMVHPLTPLCLRRAIQLVNELIWSGSGSMKQKWELPQLSQQCTNQSLLSYETYAMFNIVYNVVF